MVQDTRTQSVPTELRAPPSGARFAEPHASVDWSARKRSGRRQGFPNRTILQWLDLRARLTRKCDVDAARSECEPNPLSCCDPIDHDTILVTETRHGTTTGHSCARGDRNVIAAEVGDIAQVVHASAASDPGHTNIHH